MNGLASVHTDDDILPQYRQTPVGELLRYQNLGRAHEYHERARLLIGMCMDHRKMLRIPDNFAYILRAGGGNLRRIKFKVSYAVAIDGIRTICLIGHNHCGMVNLVARRDTFIRGLIENGGWDAEAAARHFDEYAPMFEIGDPTTFVQLEAQRLRQRYPKVAVAPLFYNVENGRLSQVVDLGR